MRPKRIFHRSPLPNRLQTSFILQNILMNEPSVIQSQQAKWMEVILLCLGIVIPIQTGPVIYQYLTWSDSRPDLLCNGLGALLILALSLSLLLKYQPFPQCILKVSPSNLEISGRDCESSGWLTIGIFTFGLLVLVYTIPRMLFVLGDRLSPWFTLNQEALGITKDKIWLYLASSCLEFLPQLTTAILFTFFPQPVGQWVRSLQKRWGSLKTEPPKP